MMRLVIFELTKIWKKRSFIISVIVLLMLNLLLLWYRQIPTDGEEDTYAQVQEERRKVSGYAKYLEQVQEKKDRLRGISIFSGSGENTFSGRNVDKSAEDYARMKDTVIEWQPSHGITFAMENDITDMLLFLSILLFVGGLITEEKEKKLFFMTHATRYGRAADMAARLAALFVHCLSITAVMFATNLLYAAMTEGIGKLTVSIQSLAPYMESCFRISVLGYILLSVITKGLVLFCFGVILTTVAIAAQGGYAPGLVALLLLGISGFLYALIPAYSVLNPLKYLNFIGAMDTEHLYGAYLNLNIAGYPISRTMLTWIMFVVPAAGMSVVCVVLFARGRQLEVRQSSRCIKRQFRPHGNVLRHEAYKILVMNRAAVVLLFFAVLLGIYGLSGEYHMSAAEEYYQKIMLQMEGTFDAKKEKIVLSERTRFEEAQAQIDRIDGMVAAGSLDVVRADAMKMKWEAVLSLYPAFERVETQYARIKETGGEFIYDTGLLYLSGRQDNSMSVCLLLQSVCMVLAFYNSISMEYRRKSWHLLGTTACGHRRIVSCKAVVCMAGAAFLAIVPWIFRSICILRIYPVNHWMNPVQDIPAFGNISIHMPVAGFLVLAVLAQMLSVMFIATIVLVLSAWRKNNVQALFFSLLIVVMPLVLKLLGFSFTGWLTVYPFYAWHALC